MFVDKFLVIDEVGVRRFVLFHGAKRVSIVPHALEAMLL